MAQMLAARPTQTGAFDMTMNKMSGFLLAVAALGVAACSDTISAEPSLLSDSTITADVASNSGEAIAVSIENMLANEGFGGLQGASASVANAADNALVYNRTRTCFNAAGAVVAGCNPISSVRKIVTHVTADGSRSGSSTTSGGTTKTWTGAVHRVSDDTLTRNFNTAQPPVEISRTHSDLTVGNDTTTFAEGDLTRKLTEATIDSIKAVTWNLPRSSNPWPVSGSIVRVVSVKVVLTKGSRTETREATRKIQVDFPADAQGNVVLKINDKTCNLNLVTRLVSNCS
jgi:hypothetical protein